MVLTTCRGLDVKYLVTGTNSRLLVHDVEALRISIDKRVNGIERLAPGNRGLCCLSDSNSDREEGYGSFMSNRD